MSAKNGKGYPLQRIVGRDEKHLRYGVKTHTCTLACGHKVAGSHLGKKSTRCYECGRKTRTIAHLESLDRRASLLRAEIADERIDAERVAWLKTLLCDYERLYRMHEADDADPDATATMLREMWGMHAGLAKIHGQYPPPEPANETESKDDWPL